MNKILTAENFKMTPTQNKNKNKNIDITYDRVLRVMFSRFPSMGVCVLYMWKKSLYIECCVSVCMCVRVFLAKNNGQLRNAIANE